MTRGPKASFNQSDVVLAALSANGAHARFNPIQVQKLLFLIDREIADEIGGPHFDFKPYHYGPYDPTVFDVAEWLSERGKVVIEDSGPYRRYLVSEAGLDEGLAIVNQMVKPASRYVSEASEWVLSRSFRELVSAIHRHYPDMAVNSRIPEAALRGVGRKPERRLHPFLQGMASVVGVCPAGRDHQSPESELDRDAMAIERAWRAVGDSLRFAIEGSHTASRVRMNGGEKTHSKESVQPTAPRTRAPHSREIPPTDRSSVQVQPAVQYFEGPLPPASGAHGIRASFAWSG